MKCDWDVGTKCDECDEPCIFKLTDEEWEAYSRYATRIISALQEKQFLEEDIDMYWKMKKELEDKGMAVEDVVNINLNSLRRQKKDVENRIKQLRRAELYYKNQLMKRQKK